MLFWCFNVVSWWYVGNVYFVLRVKRGRLVVLGIGVIFVIFECSLI